MLSVARREDVREGIGLRSGRRGEMEENELEEGEACSGQEDDAIIDPDVALSYIDDKIQDVLGHFQKDFEGGVSAENLGAKFGGYGSFLPTYQRSPSIWSHPRSPQRASNYNASRSPSNPPVEGACQNSTVSTSAPVLLKNNSISTAPSSESSRRKETRTSAPSVGGPQNDLSDKPAKSSDPKILKVRIKVGSDNALARNNAEIYCGLGLDISPSSSMEDSPNGSGGFSPGLQDVPEDSPTTIFQIMTCFPVLGGCFLSPLQDNLLCLVENGRPYLKDCKVGGLCKLNQESRNVFANLIPPARDGELSGEKKIKYVDKSARALEVKSLNGKDGGNDIAAILKKEIDIESPAGRELVSNALNIPILSGSKGADDKAERRLVGNAVNCNDILWEPNKANGKDRMTLPDIAKEEKPEIMLFSRVGNLCNDSVQLKEKLKSRKDSTEKAVKEGKTNSQKNVPLDPGKEGRDKFERNLGVFKVDVNGLKGRKDDIVDPAEPFKLKAPEKVTSFEQDGEKMFQGKDQFSCGKRKSKENQTNGMLCVELPKENLKAVSSMPLKGKKKSSHSRGDDSENKHNASKPHKESSRIYSRECDRDVVGDAKVEWMENRTDITETLARDKSKEPKFEYQNDTVPFSEKRKERPGVKKFENPPTSEAFGKSLEVPPLTGNGLASDAVPVPSAPVVIEEHWVCCDKCQKWRLLPYGTNPDNLPKKWLCSMLNWLPGMNRCNISEEETTRALNALYQIPVTENQSALYGSHNGASTGTIFASAQHLEHDHDPGLLTIPVVGKKKHGIKDALNAPSKQGHIINSEKKKQQVSIKRRSLSDMNQYSMEANSSSKSSFQHTSKTTEFTVNKHNHKLKEKHKLLERFSDEGDFIEQSGKPLKSKNKKEFMQDGFRTSKKLKVEGTHYMNGDWHSDHDLSGKTTPIMGNGLSTKVSGKNSLKCNDNSSSKDSKCNSKDSLVVSRKKSKAHMKVSLNGDFKEHFSASDVEKSHKIDFAAKKRKVKDWQEDQVHPETAVNFGHPLDGRINVEEIISGSELKKQKKAKVKPEVVMECSISRMDHKMDKAGRVTRVFLSSSRNHLLDGMEEEHKSETEKEQRVQHQGIALPERNLDLEPLKRDSGYAQPSTAATSSSSKVSGSHKSKGNFQEARGSPVESVSSSPLRFSTVSSSPLRFSNTDKVATKKNLIEKDNAINIGFSVMGSPRRCSDGEVDVESDRSGTMKREAACSITNPRSLESHRVEDSAVLDLKRSVCDYRDTEATQISGGKVKDGMLLKVFRSTHDDPSHSEFENNMATGVVSLSDQHNKYLNDLRGKDQGHDQEKLNNHYHASGPSQRKSGKSSSARLREKHRSSKSGVDKGHFKISDSFSGQENLYSMKNDNNSRYKADIDSCEHSNYHEDLKDEKYNISEKDEKKSDTTGKQSSECRRENHSNSGMQENLEPHGSFLSIKQHKNDNSRASELGTVCGKGSKSHVQENVHSTISREDEKQSKGFLYEQTGKSEMAIGKGKPQSFPHSGDKREPLNWGPQAVPAVTKGNRLVVSSADAVNSDASKLTKQSRKLDNQNGTHYSSSRHPTPTGLDAASPVRKDGSHSAAACVLKDARELKHTANRLKSEGLDHESTGLYFEAALKFLHVASLLESSGAESGKHGETTQSMSMYSDTAKLCEFCAHEYERCKEMAAAALAYKCMEVAYMKVVFSKNSSASKDQHELQTALQMVPLGESPSSSASDIDNLNNQATLEKAAPIKGVSSPQIAGSHVISARNRPNFVRLLNFAQDINYAMEASRKSHSAFASAIVNVEKARCGTEGISSVRRVLDFSFHDVEGLLRLVRLSMDSISH